MEENLIDGSTIKITQDFANQVVGLTLLNLYPLKQLLPDGYEKLSFNDYDKKLFVDGEILTTSIDFVLTEDRVINLVFHCHKDEQKVFSYFVSFFQKSSK